MNTIFSIITAKQKTLAEAFEADSDVIGTNVRAVFDEISDAIKALPDKVLYRDMSLLALFQMVAAETDSLSDHITGLEKRIPQDAGTETMASAAIAGVNYPVDGAGNPLAPAPYNGNPTVSSDGTSICYDFSNPSGAFVLDDFITDLKALSLGVFWYTSISVNWGEPDSDEEVANYPEGLERPYKIPSNIQVTETKPTPDTIGEIFTLITVPQARMADPEVGAPSND